MRRWQWGMVGVLLFAFAARWWYISQVPPGWRDDDLINSLVISRKIMDGDLTLFYVDASGHEILYHATNGVMLTLFGANVVGIRLLSAFLGTLGVATLYQIGRRLVAPPVGFIAALAVSGSFWALMYSRIGLRHISIPFLVPIIMGWVWHAWQTEESRASQRAFVMAGITLGVTFYTYFASRGLPLILAAWLFYALVVDNKRWRQKMRGILSMVGVSALMWIPLWLTLRQQPQGRVAELAGPLIAARAGDWQPVWQGVWQTIRMFHSYGDNEWLYNIPYRPVFGGVGALFFGASCLWLVGLALRPLLPQSWWRRAQPASVNPSLVAALCIAWLIGGIAPAFVSVPSASLGHTIVALPVVYLIPSWGIWQWSRQRGQTLTARWLLFSLLFVIGGVMSRDLPAYFADWGERGNVRFLYHADLSDVADYLSDHPEVHDIGITHLLAGPWASEAFQIEIKERGVAVQARWYNPERGLIIKPDLGFTGYPVVVAQYKSWLQPVGPTAGGYQLTRVLSPELPPERVCFVNGLCWVAAWSESAGGVSLVWQAATRVTLPPRPLISNPPPPDVYAGPQLFVFAQLLDGDGRFLAGDDGLWVDPASLQPGDIFVQYHQLPDIDDAILAIGLYNPETGERILTQSGVDAIQRPWPLPPR